MTKSKLMREADALSEVACEWIARLHDNPSEQTRRDFGNWIRKSPSHMAAILTTKAQLRELTERDFRSQLEQQQAVDSSNHSVHIESSSHGRYIPPARFRMAYAVMCAAVIITICLLIPLKKKAPHAARTWVYSQAGTYDLGIDSTMSLSSSSSAHVYVFRENGRRVVITGTVSFSGRHDLANPLQVIAGNTVIDVVGTVFEVKRDPDTTTVTVMKGRVNLSSFCDRSAQAPQDDVKLHDNTLVSSPAVLLEGHVGVMTGGGCSSYLAVRNLHEQTVTPHTAKAPEIMYFTNTTVHTVVTMFNQYSTSHIVVSDPVLAESHIGGTFRPSDPKSFFVFLERTLGATITHRITPDGSDTVIIYSASQHPTGIRENRKLNLGR